MCDMKRNDDQEPIDVEYTPVEDDSVTQAPEEKKTINNVEDVPPEVMMELLDEVNASVEGYRLILQASADMCEKLIQRGVKPDIAADITGVLLKRCGNKAQEAVDTGSLRKAAGVEDKEETNNG